MQKIIMYLRADSVNAKAVDPFNQITGVLPAVTRGMRALLCLRLLDGEGEPVNNLNYASWDFVLASDFLNATPPEIHVTDGITAEGNEIQIPLTETNTEELISTLGNQAGMTIGAELAGFETGETTPGFLLQFDIQIRNRRGGAGTGMPAPVPDGNYSAPQINALFAARMEVEFSTDGESWSPDQSQESRRYRFRNAAVGLEWSDPLPLIIGPRGFRSTLEIGAVATGAADSEAAVSNSGDEFDAVLDFSIPRGIDGRAATITVGSVIGGAPGSVPSVVNSGDGTHAVFDFTIPEGHKGDTGEASYLYAAYAEDTQLRGFSLTPAAHLRYRAEIVRRVPLNPPSINDFATAEWVKYLGDDGATFGDVLVADQSASVAKVNRIVFENASIRGGDEGEVIVSFHNPGVSDETLRNFSLLNGKTRLSSWINGGGSPGEGSGVEADTGDLSAINEIENFSTFKGE